MTSACQDTNGKQMKQERSSKKDTVAGAEGLGCLSRGTPMLEEDKEDELSRRQSRKEPELQ